MKITCIQLKYLTYNQIQKPVVGALLITKITLITIENLFDKQKQK